MDGPEMILRARRAVTPDGTAARWVGVRGGRIVAVEPYDTPVPEGVPVVDLAVDEVLLPGLVDTHVHVNEPGRTEWEGFATATRAAAAGGVTTLIGRGGDRPCPRRRRLPLRGLPRLPPARRGEPRDRLAAGAGAVDRGAHPRPAPVQLGRAADARLGPA
jgi:Amidohydrolase family